MKYTVNQVLSLTNIPSQTLRIWREKLPPIQGRNGYKACFTAGDALALKVIQKLTGEIGLPVSRLIPISGELFSACQGGYWPVLEKSYLKLDLSNNVLETVPLKTSSSSINTSLLLLPISNEVAHLRTALMPESATNYSQQELHFPPTILAGGSKK